MNLFIKLYNRLIGRKVHEANELKPLKTERIGLGMRLQKPKLKKYIAKVALTYEGHPLRQLDTTVEAYSRDNAASKVDKGLSVKLISVTPLKKQ